MPFDLQPTLVGELLELHPLQESDFERLFSVASDPLIWEQHPASDRYKPDVFRQFFRDAMTSGGAFVVIDRQTREAIGSSRYNGHDQSRREIEIGWTFLARRYWGGRFNGEMKRLLLSHAFQFVDAVLFIIGTHNIRSQRAIERLGAVRVGERRESSGRENYVYRLTPSSVVPTGV